MLRPRAAAPVARGQRDQGEGAGVHIERIFTRAPGGGPLIEHRAVRVVAGSGIEGDRYFGCHDEPGQNLTLVEAEVIEAFQAEAGRAVDLSVTARNLVTRGVRLNALVGREFSIGGVRLRGVELCDPCLTLGEALAGPGLAPAAVVRRFVDRGGLRCDVLDDGQIAIGMALQATA
jgi:MOSC domain-containing protein YiiM